MVARFHDAGLEVILDVVYNHTAEGNERGPTLSFKGIDNASYYRLLPDKPRYYINDTGTGNTLNLSRIRASSRWSPTACATGSTETHVDGFRFDLGTILAREPDGFDHQSGFLKACCQDPVLSAVKLIAEPWDCGPGGYQVGGISAGLGGMERPVPRHRPVISGRVTPRPRALPTRLCASDDVFNHRGRKPWASVNFVTAHDGFTVNDLVTYNEKHNEANGENNKDGSSDNHSWNCGVEGPTDDKAISQLRDRQRRNLLGTLLLAQGTPMLLAGDEFARTPAGQQQCLLPGQRHQLDRLGGRRQGQAARSTSSSKLTALRAKYPILRRGRFLTGQYNKALEVKDVAWINANGTEMTGEQWGDDAMRCFGMLMDGRAQPTGIPQRGQDATLLMVFNAHHDMVRFTLPEVPGGGTWSLLIDTNLPEQAEKGGFRAGHVYEVTARSLLLLALER